MNTVVSKPLFIAFLSMAITGQSQFITVGTQVWSTENLNIISFRNGETIPEVKSKADWTEAGESGKPAWCYYKNDSNNGQKYGKLYNWFAVSDPRGLCPSGWHVPSMDEWVTLRDYLDKNGEKLKMKPTQELLKNSSTEFYMVPGGYRSNVGLFDDNGSNGYWWTATALNGETEEKETSFAMTQEAWIEEPRLLYSSNLKARGLSVRCIKN